MMTVETIDLKLAIVTLLENNQEIGMKCDLSCYPTHDGFFFVDYILNPETVGLLSLDAEQKDALMEEEELIEIFDRADDAADFYLKLTGGKIFRLDKVYQPQPHNKKRTLKEKVLAHDKDKYF